MKLILMLVTLLALEFAAGTVLAQEDRIEEVTVYGRAQQFYLKDDSELGAKIDLDQLDLPQSLQVLSEQLIIDQAARDITDLYRSIAGVSEFSYSGVTFRGFRDSGNVFYDGVRGDSYSGFSVPQIFNVEKVEVLKGPSSALYGGGEPGGIINYVTKKPTFERFGELSLSAGNFNLKGGQIDMRGGLTDSVAYRAATFYEKEDSFRDNASKENLILAGGLLFKLAANTELLTTVDHVQQDLGGHRLRGVLAADNGDFIVDRSFNTNESFDFQNLEATTIQARLKHRFSDNSRITATLRLLENEREQAYHEPRGWVDVNGDGEANVDDGTIRREYRDQFRANDEASLTLDYVKILVLGNFEHTLLVGGDIYDVDSDFDYLRARYEADNVRNLNVFTPNYGETDPSTYNLRDLNTTGGKFQRSGFYLQDYVRFSDRWSLLAGLRYDNFEDEAKSDGFTFSDSNIAPRLGLTFKPNEDSAYYLNYSESFKPTSLRTQEAVLEEEDISLDPETGRQWELGLKQKLLSGRALGTVAIYQIVKRDLALSNPNDTGPGDGITALVNLGEVESKGIEFTLVGDISDNWTVTANYAFNDTTVVRGSRIRNTFGDGDKFVNAPEHQFGFWTRYDFVQINSSIAFGLDYVSEQISFDDQRVKSYQIADASWTTSWDKATLQINVNNIFDKEYAVSGFVERTGHFPGAPREILGRLTYSF